MAESLRDLNILFDPLSELLTVLHSNQFGITSFVIDEAHSFPRSETDKAAVLEQSKQTQQAVQGVCGRARVILLDQLPKRSAGLSSAEPAERVDELARIEVGILLDHRGYTVRRPSWTSPSYRKTLGTRTDIRSSTPPSLPRRTTAPPTKPSRPCSLPSHRNTSRQ